MNRFWSKTAKQLTPYTPGEQSRIDNLVKLNTNENPYAPSPKVLQAIARATNNDLRKYPDPTCADLEKTIANYYNLKNENVFLGNGSDEVLAHVFQALLKHDLPLLMPDISYSFYPVYCNLYGVDFKKIPLRDDFTLSIDDYQLANGGILFANPNAPTGLALGLEKIENLLRSNADSILVIDEAYIDFAEQSEVNSNQINTSAVSLIDKYPNLLVVQTLSKSRSLAGLRVGYALGHANLIAALNCVKNSFHPYALGKLALAGAEAAFADDGYFKETRDQIISTRNSTTERLRVLGFDVLDSACNFVFATHPKKSAASLYQSLRDKAILVRHFNSSRIDNYLRISIGTNEEMDALMSALDEILAYNDKPNYSNN